MKKKILNFLMTHKKDIKTSVLALSLGILLAGYPAFAATSGLDTSKLTQIANNWVVPICTALAVIFGALGGLQFALSYKKHQIRICLSREEAFNLRCNLR